MKNIINKKNLLLFIPLIIIMITSLLLLYNSKFISSLYNKHMYKQLIWFVLGIIILLFFNKIKLLFKLSPYLYWFNLLLLILVLIFGKEINGAKAWFNYKGISLQPSELMKLTYSIYLTKILSRYKYKNIKNELIVLIKILFLFLIPSVLIFLEPDTGAIIFLIIITIFAIFFSNIKKYWLLLIIGCFIILLGSFFYLYYFHQELLIKLIGTSFFYRMDRIINFGIENNMQLENALISIGNGYLFGNGIGKPIIYIPEIATDFIFALLISTFGFIGGLVITICYFLIDLYLIVLIYKSKNKTTRIFSSGFLGIFLFGQIQNIFMNLGLLPIMGIPLPFLSYGGSTITIYFFYLSIILRLNSNNI